MRAKLANDPYIRALGFKVYPSTERSWLVVGGSKPHEVFVFNGKPKCDCTAAQFGRFCAHIAAIDYMQQRKGNMPTFELDKSSSDRGVVVPLPRKGKMAYAGLLSGWFLNENQYGTSVGVKVLVTHIAAGKGWEKLDEITEAMCFVSPKWFYNEKKNQASYLMSLAHALTDLAYPQLEKLSTDEVKHILNENVGTGFQFAASIETKKSDGTPFNAIDKDSFEPADSSFAPIAQKMTAKLDIKQNKDGVPFIAQPQPTYQKAQQAPSDDGGMGDELNDEVPF